MTLPNMLIIGAPKSGTTSLYQYISGHPQVYMSPIKEPFFFASDNGRLDYPGTQVLLPFGASITTPNAYEALFAGATSQHCIIGEASATYLYNSNTPARIKRLIPSVKMIAILRHPVERAFSQFMDNRRDGREPMLDFARALAVEDERIRRGWRLTVHYRAMGFYFQQLTRYYSLFPKEQIDRTGSGRGKHRRRQHRCVPAPSEAADVLYSRPALLPGSIAPSQLRLGVS